MSQNQNLLSFEGAHWHLNRNPESTQAIIQENHVSEILAICLAQLGLTPGKEVDEFLHPNLHHLYDPHLMRDMDKGIRRLKQAIDKGESIRIVTDYDVDGTMSSLILQSVLRICGHNNLSYHIPDRKIEGYGLSRIAVEKAIEDHIDMIVTADIGIREADNIAFAQENHIDVIVLDHHLPEGAGIPSAAYAVLCPPRPDCKYPNKALAACGISLKFAQALLADHPKCDTILRSLIKLAALGTVADVVSLKDQENRAIVAIGLDSLNHDPHKPGLEALLSVAQTPPGSIDSTAIGFRIGPRINAAGRMATATLIIELLHAKNRVEAQGLAAKLEAMNGDRKYIQDQMVEHATEILSQSKDPFLFIALPESSEWHAGISGIVAGRLREKFNKPVAVATICGQTATGSIRSTPGIHAVEALTSVSQYLTKFGGHAAAAGFTCNCDQMDNVIKGLCHNAVEQLNGEQEIPVTEVALMMEPKQLKSTDYDELRKLEPCGKDNHRPILCLKNVTFNDIRFMKGIHFCGTTQINDTILRCIWFNPPETFKSHLDAPMTLIGEYQKDTWNGETRYQFMIKDGCPSKDDVFI